MPTQHSHLLLTGALNPRMWVLRSVKHFSFLGWAKELQRETKPKSNRKWDFGTGHYLPRRVTASVQARYFSGHWNPVCEYLHWATGAEVMLRGHGQAGATGHHSLNMVPSCCLLLYRLLSYMATTVFTHVWIWNSSKYDVMCGTECHLAGTKVFILSYEVFFFLCVCMFV